MTNNDIVQRMVPLQETLTAIQEGKYDGIYLGIGQPRIG